MGTYAPAPAGIVSKEVLAEIDRTVIEPTLKGMSEEGYPFVGCLFTGYMITKNGPKLLEYNVRFGDPETQSLLLLLESDLAQIMLTCANGSLVDVELKISDRSAATVVMAAGGYPDSYKKGIEMKLEKTPEDVYLFHAGTSASEDGKLVTSGGRVIASSAVASDLKSAIAKAYEGVSSVSFDGMQYRKDIGARALR
jgi:phosphoribosylamine--glycine ligase/phosphoribosylformylglycinamidine cyclo-ligase